MVYWHKLILLLYCFWVYLCIGYKILADYYYVVSVLLAKKCHIFHISTRYECFTNKQKILNKWSSDEKFMKGAFRDDCIMLHAVTVIHDMIILIYFIKWQHHHVKGSDMIVCNMFLANLHLTHRKSYCTTRGIGVGIGSLVIKFYVKVYMWWAGCCQASYPICWHVS